MNGVDILLVHSSRVWQRVSNNKDDGNNLYKQYECGYHYGVDGGKNSVVSYHFCQNMPTGI